MTRRVTHSKTFISPQQIIGEDDGPVVMVDTTCALQGEGRSTHLEKHLIRLTVGQNHHNHIKTDGV